MAHLRGSLQFYFLNPGFQNASGKKWYSVPYVEVPKAIDSSEWLALLTKSAGVPGLLNRVIRESARRRSGVLWQELKGTIPFIKLSSQELQGGFSMNEASFPRIAAGELALAPLVENEP